MRGRYSERRPTGHDTYQVDEDCKLPEGVPRVWETACDGPATAVTVAMSEKQDGQLTVCYMSAKMSTRAKGFENM